MFLAGIGGGNWSFLHSQCPSADHNNNSKEEDNDEDNEEEGEEEEDDDDNNGEDAADDSDDDEPIPCPWNVIRCSGQRVSPVPTGCRPTTSALVPTVRAFS